MPAQSVHQTRTLAHQPLPATVQQPRSLLVSRLDRHKAHRRPHNRLADRRRIRRGDAAADKNSMMLKSFETRINQNQTSS